MPVNKDALIRYKVLDKCFRNSGKQYFIDDLIEECSKMLLETDPSSNGISKRQVQEDIKFMESEDGWSVDLVRHRAGKKFFYRYADTTYSINNTPLNETEISQLQSAVQILSHFKGMPQFEWMQELIPKLKQGISTGRKTIIDFDSNQYLKGIDLLGNLYNAILYRKVLSIEYQPYENEQPFRLVLHPYYLKQYNNRWFLLGYNPDTNKANWNLALDRIVSLKEKQTAYFDSEINWEEYFEDIIGVTKPENAEVEKVVLHFFGKTGKYMETKPIHGSQKTKWLDKDTLEVTLDIIINYELERFILSYADSVRVIAPDFLKNKIMERQTNSLNQYVKI